MDGLEECWMVWWDLEVGCFLWEKGGCFGGMDTGGWSGWTGRARDGCGWFGGRQRSSLVGRRGVIGLVRWITMVGLVGQRGIVLMGQKGMVGLAGERGMVSSMV
jgi:hypothetical protein